MSANFGIHSAPMRGAALMIATGALFAVANTVVQFGTMRAGLSPSLVAFWQYAIVLLLALPWLVATGFSAAVTQRRPLHFVQVVLAAAGIQFWVLGLAYVPIWQAVALGMLSTFFVTIGARLFLGEVIGPARSAAVLLGFLGGMIILAPWSDAFSFYATLPVIAAIFWSGSSLMIKHLTITDRPETITFYMVLFLTPINGVILLGNQDVEYSSIFWIVVLIAGVVTAVAQYTLAAAYSLADASFLQPFDHLKLPVNVALGVLVFGFWPPGSMLVGSLLIVGASAYLLNSERTRVTA